MTKKPSGNEIRQSFIDFFVERGHTFVPSMSLVPGGDATLLFTNSGMVQFKDVFLGTDKRDYTRVVDAQKCMRVAGKHNDLEDVGQDDTHHTFFEMLGNWSFGDYYKKEAIGWSWELLTERWGLPKDRLYATCFKDDRGAIPQDDEAAEIWRAQPGMDPAHVLFFGRKDNFWQMAEHGPCGPCSEIHLDLGEERDNLRGQPHRCGVNGECTRFLELWNNVFIQYNLFEGDRLEPLPAKHVDTGMGFERIVSVLQGVDSNYKTDLFAGALAALAQLTGKSREEMYADFTPYRVIADHARSAAFLIGDGVVPGNAGRNYVCRMIIRRAARFGSNLGLRQPFLAQVAGPFIDQYGAFYPELVKYRETILDNLTREEARFARTVEAGTAQLETMLNKLLARQTSVQWATEAGDPPEKHAERLKAARVLDGREAFELYATYGLPLEISRDIAREKGLDVDEAGFRAAREAHSLASGGGKAMGALGGEDAEFFAALLKDLQASGRLDARGVIYDPYTSTRLETEVLALVVEGRLSTAAQLGDQVEVILPKTGFYIESGGQVSDTGTLRGADWEIEISGMRHPAAGLISHVGEVVSGRPRVGDQALAEVDGARRHDIMRNHTATHLLHTALHQVLGDHARQAGSLVAPSHLRFDFTHPAALTAEQLERVEQIVNDAVAADYAVQPRTKPRDEAIAEGAMALFGEKYGEVVRTITIAEAEPQEAASADPTFSYELCGGTHLERTSDVGAFLIVSEGSAAAGIRRIEAVTGRGAYQLTVRRFRALKQAAAALKSNLEEVPAKAEATLDELAALKKQLAAARADLALATFNEQLARVQPVHGVNLLVTQMAGIDKESLTKLADAFRGRFPDKGVCVIASTGESVTVMAAVTQDLIKKGLKAGDLVGYLSRQLGAGGGGAPHLAFGGGKDASNLPNALASLDDWLAERVG